MSSTTLTHRRQRRRRDRSARWPSAALLAWVCVAGCGDALPGETMRVRKVQRAILDDSSAWQVVRAAAGREPYVDVITPSIDTFGDASDMPALLMHPPCEVSFEVRPADGEVVLRAAAGVDQKVARRLKAGQPDVIVDFEVLVNGSNVFSERIATRPKEPNEERHWRRVGGAAGLPLRPGDIVTLKTLFPPQPEPALRELWVGFGGLVLESTRERPRARASTSNPNLVLLVMDTQRRDRMSSYGYAKETTPRFDEWASRATVYEDAYSTSSWTWPATASILTGLLPDAHGVTSHHSCFVAHELETLAEALQEVGYTTGAFSGNPLIHASRNFQQGFETFSAPTDEFVMSDDVVPAALEWIHANRERRFFLYLHLVDPHSPHTPRPEDLARLGGTRPAGFPDDGIERLAPELKARWGRRANASETDEALTPARVRWMSDVYDASVATGDYWFGEVLDALAANGLAQATVVAYTADHGEELLDHGMLAHAHTLYPELVRVPLALAGPGVASGLRVSTPVSNLHLAHTLARLGGAQLARLEDPMDLVDPASLRAEPLFFQTEKGFWNGRELQTIYGTRRGSRILHFCPTGLPAGAAEGSADDTDPGPGQLRLFDALADPTSENDLAAQHPDEALALRTLITRRLLLDSAMRPKGNVRAGAATMRMLRNIGYAHSDELGD